MAFSTIAVSALNTPAVWVSLCSRAAPLVSTGVCLAPFPTVANIVKLRSVGSLPLMPYSSMVVNSFVWVVYGIMKNEVKIWSPNAFGLLMSSYYCMQYRRFVPKKASNLPGTLSQHVRYGFLLMTLTVLMATQLSKGIATDLVGKLAVFLCVILFISPLSTLKTVIATKSAKSIPLPFTLACMMNCFLWSIAGIFEMKDFNVYFPNLLGLSSAIAQFVLIMLYGDGSKRGTALPL
mmetsp:Transcript_30486/g.35027  ORF Transcript_30486/g.35027 Transcript_30486/m.35027 type:complete len:235 (+) Transcript_30486:66-770(+)